MPSYYREKDKCYLETGWIDDIGLGLIDGDMEVYCSAYYNSEENGCLSMLYLRDKDNYIGNTYICMDKPEYRRYENEFSLSSRRRQELYDLLTKSQFYGISGWELCMRAIGHECNLRKIDFIPIEMPDYRRLPSRDEGFRTETEKRYCEALGEYESLEEDPMYEIDEGVFIIAMPLRKKPDIGFYFKVMKMDTSDPDEWFEDRRVICWCRISMERAEYITGYDECMTLTDEQIDNMMNEFGKMVPGSSEDHPRSHWQRLVGLYANDYDVCKVDVNIDEEMPMPDYSILKELKT